MVLPAFVVPALAAGGGGALGYLIGSVFGTGSSKKDATVTAGQGVNIAPMGVYAPSPSSVYSPYYSYQVQIESPLASQTATKKDEITASPAPSIPLSVSQVPQIAQQDTKGIDLTQIVIISAIGLIAYGIVSKPTGGKK